MARTLFEVDVAALMPPGLTAYPELVAQIIPDFVEQLRNEIVALAHERVKPQQLQHYLDNVGEIEWKWHPGRPIPVGTTLVAYITMTDEIAVGMEVGMPAYDMKPGLLAGRNATRTKDGGWMNTVPFRHGTPGTSGRNFPAMGTAYAREGVMSEKDATALGKRIYAAAKQLAPTLSHPTKGVQSAGKQGRLPAGMAPKLRKKHATDIYAGMIRNSKDYASDDQSTYMTFRRVSSKSRADSWIHPGFEGAGCFEEAASRAGAIAGKLIKYAMPGITGGTP